MRITVTDPVMLPTNYDRDLGELITACGFRYSHPDITTANFPGTKTGIAQEEYMIFGFERSRKKLTVAPATPAKLIPKWDASRPWQFAQPVHLLTYGVAFPDEQRKYLIIALGVAMKDDKRLYLGLTGEGRCADIGVVGRKGWYSDEKFLAFRPALGSSAV